MEAYEQRYIADELGRYRERLESARNDLAPTLDEQGQPAHPIALRMVQVEGRMLAIEHYLNDDVKALERRERYRPSSPDRMAPHTGHSSDQLAQRRR